MATLKCALAYRAAFPGSLQLRERGTEKTSKNLEFTELSLSLHQITICLTQYKLCEMADHKCIRIAWPSYHQVDVNESLLRHSRKCTEFFPLLKRAFELFLGFMGIDAPQFAELADFSEFIGSWNILQIEVYPELEKVVLHFHPFRAFLGKQMTF